MQHVVLIDHRAHGHWGDAEVATQEDGCAWDAVWRSSGPQRQVVQVVGDGDLELVAGGLDTAVARPPRRHDEKDRQTDAEGEPSAGEDLGHVGEQEPDHDQ